MKQEEKKTRNRRTNEQLDRDVMSELEKLVAEQGFGNVNLSTLTKAAGMEANVFYRRYGSMDNLYDKLAKQYDFWMNNAIDISNLNVLGPKNSLLKHSRHSSGTCQIIPLCKSCCFTKCQSSMIPPKERRKRGTL